MADFLIGVNKEFSSISGNFWQAYKAYRNSFELVFQSFSFLTVNIQKNKINIICIHDFFYPERYSYNNKKETVMRKPFWTMMRATWPVRGGQ